MRANNWLWALAALLVVLFVWGAEQVAVMPLQTGEVYPPYSSLRADPVGTKALYESLAALPELDVSRLYKQRSVLDAGTTLLVLGVEPRSWSSISEEVLTGYERLLQKGGRLVIAFLPARAPRVPPQTSSAELINEKWTIRLAYRKIPGQDSSDEAIPRRSELYFRPGPPWSILTQRDGAATTVERALAGGTVVLIADSYPLSNEGLRKSHDAVSIARLIGSAHKVAFDENHFGVAESGSVVALMRKYQLEGALAILSMVVILFVWHSASSFLPPRESTRDRAVTGRDSQEGLTALLRRNVPEPDLLDACYREWSRSAPPARQAELVEAAIARTKGQTPAEVYRAACTAANVGQVANLRPIANRSVRENK
jgi:hypothetical protein